MTEVFEIGVSLALQDGVSDAVRQARHDVSALAWAVRDSGISVRALHEAGVKAASASFGDQRGQRAEGAAQHAAAGGMRTAEAAAGAAPVFAFSQIPDAPPDDVWAPRSGASEAARSEENGSAAGLQAAASLDRAARNARVLPDAVAAVPIAMLGPPPERVSGLATTGIDGVGAVRAADRGRQAEPRMPLGGTMWPDYAGAPDARATEAAAEQGVSAAPDEQRSFRQVSLINALHLAGGSIGPVQHAYQPDATPDDAGSGAGDPAAGQMGGASFPAAVAAAWAPSLDGGGAGAQRGQQGEQPAAGPQQGDVFLDGMLVGRWMSRFLNREAERASSGPTGFDARRGRILPGVTVGA